MFLCSVLMLLVQISSNSSPQCSAYRGNLLSELMRVSPLLIAVAMIARSNGSEWMALSMSSVESPMSVSSDNGSV